MQIINIVDGQEVDLNAFSLMDIPYFNIEIKDILREDLEAISSKFNIDIIDLEDVFDIEERPRLDYDHTTGYFQFVLRYPLDNVDPINTTNNFIPIIFFITPKFSIVIHTNNKFLSSTNIKPKKSKVDFSTEEPFTALLKPLWSVLGQIEKSLEKCRGSRVNLEERIFSSTKTAYLKEIFKLNTFLVLFESNTKGNLLVIKRLIHSGFIPLKKNILLAGKYDDIETDFEQYAEQVSIMREGLTSSLDAYGSIIGNNLNEVMKTLTLFTVLISNPILIASLYGTNVQLPFGDSPLAFVGILIISFFISAIMIFYMKRKGIF